MGLDLGILILFYTKTHSLKWVFVCPMPGVFIIIDHHNRSQSLD
jgi:hypothetical protein